MTEAHKDPHLPKMMETESGLAPEAPMNLKTVGLSESFLLDLALKTAHAVSQFTTESMAQRLHLPQAVVADLLEKLRTTAMLEILGPDGPFGYRYTITQQGRQWATGLMEVSGYVGPAPVSLEAYRAMLEWQMEKAPRTTMETVHSVLSDLVLPEASVEIAGLVISSGRSLFLFGPPGNGKTSLGRQMHKALQGEIWIPHAIAVDNNVVRLFDAHCHEPAPHAAGKHQAIDRRWIKIHRPFIVAGGEMTLESLDMAYMPSLKYYEAPLHMKANGGTFLIDDFGRQHVAPTDLLNRWIIPLEHRFDYLSLHSGQKIQVPFLLMLIIATNLSPKDVTDPAFLRRIGYRLRLSPPTEAVYTKVFEQYAAKVGITVDPGLMQRLLERYRAASRELRCCEPRDLIERVKDICQHRNQPLSLSDELLDLAWDGYFGSDEAQAIISAGNA